ncbi:oxidase-like protein [Mycena vitilis]|nr:oxidase-like protein [Mycena vitilis]
MLFPALLQFFLISTSVGFPASFFEQAEPRSFGFDSEAQYIDVTGAHAYVPPGPEDMRGPCPGLNSLANHNFIPHNGIVSLGNSITASFQVYGMAIEAATFAGVLAALYAGDFSNITLPYSIGGPPPCNVLGSILQGLGLFGCPRGLSLTHNQFESDSSATRGDYYQFNGDAHSLQMPAFLGLYNRQAESPDANYNQSIVFAHRVRRLLDSIQQNGDFFYGPVQMVISCLTTNLVYGLMSNHSTEYPNGVLSNNVLKAMYGITGPPGALVYTRGTERIPENWYRRSLGDPYGAARVVTDLAAMAVYDPRTVVFGGNTHGPNTFAPIDLHNFTGGVYNAAALLQGDNAACFVFQATRILFPSALVGLESVALKILRPLLDVVDGILAGLTCPRLESVDSSIFEQYPGYRKSSRPV